MKLGDFAKKAKQAFEQRGGADALKQDIGELKDVAKGEGSLADKAKGAVAAIKDPGAAEAGEAPRTEAPRAEANEAPRTGSPSTEASEPPRTEAGEPPSA